MEWKNLDTLTSFEELSKVAEVDLTKVMSGENGAERVKNDRTFLQQIHARSETG